MTDTRIPNRRPKRADLSTIEVLSAIAICRTDHGNYAWEYLCRRYPPKVVWAALDREDRRGHINWGVSMRRPWLEGKGEQALRKLSRP
jgi:hypothetical protein